jgi:hypothetical protein
VFLLLKYFEKEKLSNNLRLTKANILYIKFLTKVFWLNGQDMTAETGQRHYVQKIYNFGKSHILKKKN